MKKRKKCTCQKKKAEKFAYVKKKQYLCSRFGNEAGFIAG